MGRGVWLAVVLIAVAACAVRARNQNDAKRAADSTYHALDEAWGRLVAAHPKQVFTGNRPRKR